eukprot:364489-Chlamydomonas_euryale.AAC.5
MHVHACQREYPQSRRRENPQSHRQAFTVRCLCRPIAKGFSEIELPQGHGMRAASYSQIPAHDSQLLVGVHHFHHAAGGATHAAPAPSPNHALRLTGPGA